MLSGQQYNLTGSSELAELGQAFTWTCDMFVPPGNTINAVRFYRNSVVCVVIGYRNLDNTCLYYSLNPRYTYACLSDDVFTLTIPAENMTEMEQGSMWRCQNNHNYKSSEAILNIASKILMCACVQNCRV